MSLPYRYFLFIFCVGLFFAPACKNTSKVIIEERSEMKHLVSLSPENVEKQLSETDIAAAKKYIQESKKTVPVEILLGIENHQLWTGMSLEEVILAVGEPSEKAGGKLFYKLEGWLLQFDEEGFLLNVFDR